MDVDRKKRAKGTETPREIGGSDPGLGLRFVDTDGSSFRFLGSTASRAALAALGVFLFAFALRISNLPVAFANGVPQFAPFDEIYHAKRIAYSAARPFRVLDFDPNRGSHGAFCPWPPLYDMLAGTVARGLGGPTAVDALAIATWFPPIIASLTAAVIAGWLARRNLLAGVLAGLGVAVSTYFLDKSRLGAIDHHFLEFPLVLAVAASVGRLNRADSPRVAYRDGALLGIALVVGLLVQTATVIAGMLAMITLVLFAERKAFVLIGGALGFALAAGLIAIYRILRPPGYPDDQWYLGYPHAAVLVGAAAASAVIGVAMRREFPYLGAIAMAGASGALVLVSFPTAGEAFLAGSRFFLGDPWFSSIVEFQPLFFPRDSDRFTDFCLMGGGALASTAAAFDPAWRTGRRGTLLLFTLVYLLLAISSMRFLVVAAPLAAVVGAIAVSDLRERGFARSVGLFAILLLSPSLALSAGRVIRPSPVLGTDAVPMVKAADFTRRSNAPGRVLAPWSFGHLFNVLAERGVLMDNFGTVGGQIEFENARGIILSPRETAVADYCRWNGIRFVILQDPLPYFGGQAETSGFPRTAFEMPGAGSTRLMRSTFWWRAWFEQGRERSGGGPAGAAFRFFRLVGVEREKPTDVRPALQIWEFRPAGD
jgi:asparagine N-glycosylation enzyme membrane subunit Stt3